MGLGVFHIATMNKEELGKREIYVVRHAQSKGNVNKTLQGQIDSDLTALGFKQIEVISKFFKSKQEKFKIEKIFSSDLKRAKLTAQGIAREIDLEIEIQEGFREVNYGRWEGVSREEIQEKDPEEYRAWTLDKRMRPPWCESFKDTGIRAKKALISCFTKSKGNFVVLSHGGVIHSIIGLCQGSSYVSTLIRNCSITKILASFQEGVENPSFELLDLNFVTPSLKMLKNI